ncbi:MAG: outer membrane protein assembly factor BamD, partial [Planctomycetes bacterium]|nr:outer membrane protein assembly factor BamD [Planctomycetota bacterium]
MNRTLSPAGRAVALLAIALAVFGGLTAAARGEQLTPDQAAAMMLDSARRAYNEQKCDFAAERFREFLKTYGGHKDAAWAQFGLGLALLELPQKDYRAAAEALRPAAGRGDFPERALALYHLGAALRGIGYQELAEAEAKPNEAAAHRDAARQQFTQAAAHFAQAAEAFAARAKATPDAAAGELAWAARARCDQCEMLLRADKFKEAADLATAVLADAAQAKGPCGEAATYYLGHARFALKDYLEAGRALSRLAPFKQDFGGHARYLLARTHHLSGERPEALAQYQAVLADYEARKKAAQAALANPQALTAAEREFLQALVARPPDYLDRAAFYGALVLSEEGRFADAVTQLAAMAQQYPKSPLLPEAQLRRGYCQMQLRDYPKAIADLQLLTQNPELADRA